NQFIHTWETPVHPSEPDFMHTGGKRYTHTGEKRYTHTGEKRYTHTGEKPFTYSCENQFVHTNRKHFMHPGEPQVMHTGRQRSTHTGVKPFASLHSLYHPRETNKRNHNYGKIFRQKFALRRIRARHRRQIEEGSRMQQNEIHLS